MRKIEESIKLRQVKVRTIPGQAKKYLEEQLAKDVKPNCILRVVCVHAHACAHIRRKMPTRNSNGPLDNQGMVKVNKSQRS